jgi:hypothetical protein
MAAEQLDASRTDDDDWKIPYLSCSYILGLLLRSNIFSASFPLDRMLAKKQEGALSNNMCMLQSGVVKKLENYQRPFMQRSLESVPRGDFNISCAACLQIIFEQYRYTHFFKYFVPL